MDEIGPLEMDRGEGWTNALEVLRLGEYRLAVAVVRPSLVDAVRAAVGVSGTVVVRPGVAPGRGTVRDLLSMVELAGEAHRP